MGCAAARGNGINTVHLSHIREKTGHALIGAWQQIAAEHIADPVKSLVMDLPADLVFRTKGQLAITICADAFADGVRLDFACGDEVYGSCTELGSSSKPVARATCCGCPRTFTSRWPAGSRFTCAQAVRPLLTGTRAERSAPPGKAPRTTGGVAGRGWPPHARGTTC